LNVGDYHGRASDSGATAVIDSSKNPSEVSLAVDWSDEDGGDDNAGDDFEAKPTAWLSCFLN
jgi:hypothetical protein